MAFDFEKLKKIPLFKNVDFEDPRSKKRLALVFGSAALMLMVIIANIATSAEKPAAAADNDGVFMELPEGTDNDILNEEDMVVARQRMVPGNKDLFEEARTLNEEDPLAFLNEEDNKRLSESGPFGGSSKDERKARALAMFGLSDDGDTPAGNAAGSNEAPPEGVLVDAMDAMANAGALKDAVGQSAASRVTPADKTGKPSRAEAEAKEEEENRKAASAGKKTTPASQPRGGRTLADAERQRRDGDAYAAQPPQQEEQAVQEEQPRAVRRSGGISSLDGDWGTIEGISSLDNESVYVTQDDDHPYKVMFTRDQKLKSGDRITIRLLEDMAVDGVLIPKNTHLSATCQIGERLQITVSNIEINGRIYALNYTAFDNDGSQGLYCPISGATKTTDQGKSVATQTATTLLSSAASAAGAAMGSGALGGMLGNMANIGAQAVTSRNGSVTAQVNSGYTFYLLKNN